MSHEHRRDRSFSVCFWISLLTVLLLTEVPAQAEPLNRPFWTEQAMFRFGEDLFFVGQASCAKSAEEGRQKAFVHGVLELLNYTQALSPAGVEIATQMVFEEASTPGCPPSAVTVWRLLRVDADKVAKLTKAARYRPRPDISRPTTSPRDLTPKIGMSRDEILERFGRPWSILIHRSGTEISWEYPGFGLTLNVDQDNFVTGWRLTAPQELEQKRRLGAQEKRPSTDLTERLGKLEQSSEAPMNVVHNLNSFALIPPVDSLLPQSASLKEPLVKELSSRPFLTLTRTVPGLADGGPPFGLKGQGIVIPRCDFTLYGLSIRHLADPTGPHFSSDHRFSDASQAALQRAVIAAAKAVGYDLRFLGVSLSLPISLGPFFPYPATVDASGAAVIWAVTVASAILDDPIRSDVSVVGIIKHDLEIGPVEGLDSRINGCRQPTPLEMVLHAAQGSSDLVLREMGYGLKVAHVSTLSEAYEVATGQPLRRAQ